MLAVIVQTIVLIIPLMTLLMMEMMIFHAWHHAA
jgi:hypothetical protein